MTEMLHAASDARDYGAELAQALVRLQRQSALAAHLVAHRAPDSAGTDLCVVVALAVGASHGGS